MDNERLPFGDRSFLGNMASELYYTSALSGLKPGSSGFCTVAATAGMASQLIDRLETLSNYQHLFPPGTDQSHQNPISWSHWRISAGGRTKSVLSRICAAGLDYSRRPNKLAHHVVLEPAEQAAAGPAWLVGQPGVMQDNWSATPQWLQSSKKLPSGNDVARPCARWEEVTGDAGWAGVLAQSFLTDPTRAAYLVCEPGMDLLPLMEEASLLLPARSRWQVTFSTYFTELPAGLSCAWRCLMAGTPTAKRLVAQSPGGVVVDLTRRSTAPESEASHAARAGNVIVGISRSAGHTRSPIPDGKNR